MSTIAIAAGCLIAALSVWAGLGVWLSIRALARQELEAESNVVFPSAWADAQRCTCDPAFFPDALDAECPAHGIDAFVRDWMEIEQ